MLGTNFFIWKYHCSAKINALFIHLIESVIEPIDQSFLVQRIRLELQACFVLIDVSEPNPSMHVLKTEFVFFFRELLSLECCGDQKLLGSLHQLLLVESKEMKEASGDELSINTFIWVTRVILLDYCLKDWILSNPNCERFKIGKQQIYKQFW